MDVVNKEKRSKMMSGIRNKNTRPEMLIRKALHSRGFRYRLHDKKLPGKPDIVFKRYKSVIQVQGCFWHGHDCHLFKWPSTRKQFWRKKILGNVERDSNNLIKLQSANWKTLVIWECALKGKTKLNPESLVNKVEEWIISESRNDYVLEGNKP